MFINLALAWHPIHEGLFVSGGGDGSLGYWLVNSDKELAFLEQAHDMAIWTLEWHPLGHILATGDIRRIAILLYFYYILRVE